ncbi:myb dna-binding domain-containing protein [Diplodia corticola]|uniref:Myb dna-binding domain-containing protein n=1 Tax=Diplodia corticola TaxID=236234 RepID=A0A1J9RMT5_9PEZI|nr:myb dna-binding domain-containing protein [Diplodia corticola]OJD28917.1 myb dna-binding domain-containing protein [Diplodia corticola]
MSSRYPNDSRYTSRDRTPPRYTDRRASTYSSSFTPRNDDSSSGRPYPDSISGSASRDVPRGPKALSDSTRGPPPGGSASVPAGPRGRGFGGRSEYRELRDAPPLSDGRGGSSWRGGDRDRHFDRRDRPLSPRARSPGRDSRDSRDSRDFGPRELDIDRARRSARDGPPSAGSNYSDPPSGGFGFHGRGGFSGRGRGRGDWDNRGRGRGSFADDRNSFRPRSRSPRPRWEKEPSRDDRISDRRDDRRFDRRDDDRPFYRDDREVDRYKRDPVSSRDADIRRASVAHDGRFSSAASSTSHQSPRHPSISGHGGGVDRASTSDLPRELLPGRRASVAQEPVSAKDKPDYIAARAEASRDRYGPRASSPPPQAPQVPAFGSVSSFQKPATTFTTPTSNVWRPPQPAQPQAPASGVPSGPKIPPSAPKALSAVPPTAPTGPKATRVAEKPTVEKPAPEIPQPTSTTAEQSKPKLENGSSVPSQVPVAPSGPSSEQQDVAPRSRPPSPPIAPPTGPAALQARLPIPAPPTGPRGLVSPQQPHSRLVPPPVVPPRDGPPATNIPLGPRASGPFSTSPRGPNAGLGPGPAIPTGPKADRGPPVAPRAALFPQAERQPINAPRAPMMGIPGRNLQWIRPDAPRYSRGPGPIVPAKRDLDGDEKERYTPNRPRSPAFAVGSPVSGPATPTPSAHDTMSVRRKSASEIRSRDEAPETLSARRNSAFAFSESNIKAERPSTTPQPLEPHARESQSDEASEDDDEMDLDDEFFSQKTRYEREKVRLESRLKNLEDRGFRCSSPLKTLLRLSRIREADLPRSAPAPVVGVAPNTGNSHRIKEPERMEPDLHSPTSTMNGPMVGPPNERAEKAPPVMAQPVPKGEAPKLPTPKAEESEDVEMGEASAVEEVDGGVQTASSEDESITEVDLHSLPYLNRGPPTPLSDPDQENTGLRTNIMAAIKDKLFNNIRAEQEFQGTALHIFRMQYHNWGFESAHREKDAAMREEKEKTEEQEAAVSPSETSTTGPAHRQRHVTDYDLENILAESRRMEEERIEKQRREEEASRNPFSNGQAPIPDMLPDDELERRKFVNTNRLREPSKGILTFGFEPPEDDFSPEEHKKLVTAYLQTPKDWGEIAKALPNRNFRECINHYYATKWNGEYKPPTGRRKAKRRAGIPKGRKIAIPFASTDQVDGEDGTIATTTERGRPRRAAAPTFGDREMQDDHATPVPTPGRQRGASTRGETVEPSTEKPVKRQRVAKEKGTKRGRAAQQLAPAPSASPSKTDKDMYPGEAALDPSRMHRTEEEAALLARLPSVQPDIAGQFGETAYQVPQTAPVPERPKGRGAGSRAGGMSSYWSVNESTDFRNYLGYFGTDFHAIAKQMGTKTAAMVKNEYFRKTDSGNHPELVEIAQAADDRRSRGEDIGPPPPPTASNKRRYDTTQPAIPRTLAPTPAENVDIKQSPPAADLPARTASPHVQTGSRFPPLAQASPALSASTPPTSIIASTSVPAPSSHASAYGKPAQHEMPGPRRGFFSQREPSRAALVQNDLRQPPPEAPRDVHAEHHHHRRQYSQGLAGSQQLHDPRYVRMSAEQREREAQVTQQQEIYGSSAAAHHPLYRTSVPPQLPPQRGSEPPSEARPGQVQQGAFSRGAPQLRHLTETPSQLPIAQPPGRVSRHVSPKREESQQPYASSQPAVQATPRVASAVAEPRKTSNLADLLNPAPSEPKPKEQKPAVDDRASVLPHERPYSAQGRPIHQTTAPPPPPPVTMSSSSPAFPRRDVFTESPAPNSPFARPAYIQQTQQQQQMQAPQRRPMEVSSREQSQPPASRDPWARPAYSQPQPPVSQTSSPHPAALQQPQAPIPIDGRQQYPGNHRAALSQLNTSAQPRNVHSPTPSHAHHSRTPSYTHQQSRQQAPTPLQPIPAAPSPARENPGPVLAANPYVQMTPPQTIQQLVPQQQQVQQQAQRNEQAAIQNRTLTYAQPQSQAYENMIERERAIRLAEQRDREDQMRREHEAQTAHHSRSTSFAQSHYMRQPTPSQADHAASRFSSAGPAVPPPSVRNSAHTPTAHMGYPPPPAPPAHHGLPTTQDHAHAHGFATQVPSASQRGIEAILRREQETAMRRQQEAVVQHQQAQAQAHAHAQAHREHRYREEVAAQQRGEQIRRQHEEAVVRDRIDRDRAAERDRVDREYVERDRQRREREEWDRQQGRNIFGGSRNERGGLFGPNR